MHHFDFLLGYLRLPSHIEQLLGIPEVQRLKDIRLLNVFSPTFLALSDVRRLSHSIGVVGLSLRLLPKLTQKYSSSDIAHWQAALLLHDIGTPPFGHLLEYRLFYSAESTGWRHDNMLDEIFYGRYRWENIDDQIYFGNSLRLHTILPQLHLVPEKLSDLIRGNLPLGKLVAGSIDLDNIDNVFRMAGLLGFGYHRDELLKLVDSLDIIDDELAVEEEALPAIKLWLDLRQKIYRIFAFDVATLSLQAMLTDAFDKAIEAGVLSAAHWRLTDDDVLHLLLKFEKTKLITKRVTVFDYYQPIDILWFDDPQMCGDKLLSSVERQQFQSILSNEVGVTVVSYPFIDKGTFSKHLTVRISDRSPGSEPVVISERSNSFIVGLFTPNTTTLTVTQKAQIREAAQQYLYSLGIYSERPTPIWYENIDEFYTQRKFSF